MLVFIDVAWSVILFNLNNTSYDTSQYFLGETEEEY
jgi:hypothetical protein